MEALKLKPLYTIEDICALPEGVRAELIDGQLYYMASPTVTHQRILGNLLATIHNYLKEKGGPCEVFPSSLGVFLKEDDSTYLEPDIVVVCDPAKLENDKGCVGVPDWVIEITSPSSTCHDYLRKYNLYKRAGVTEYWIVDPQGKSVIVSTFADDEDYSPPQYSFTDKITVGIFDDLVIDFEEFHLG